jgi:hypothetical protein
MAEESEANGPGPHPGISRIGFLSSVSASAVVAVSSLDQIRAGVSGNLCRCGVYKTILNSFEPPSPDEEKMQPWTDTKIVGKGIPRVDAFERVSGKAAVSGANPLQHNSYKVDMVKGAVEETLSAFI